MHKKRHMTPSLPTEQTQPSPITPQGARTPAWALVTGASGRGGAAISKALHARGLSVLLHHTERSKAQALVLHAELDTLRPGSVRLWSADFSQPDLSAELKILQTQDIAVLVCNASVYCPSTLHDMQRFELDWAIHVQSHLAILQTLYPATLASSTIPILRSVVAITDIAVNQPTKGYVHYTLAKAALQSLMLTLAVEWAPHVRLNVVQPGALPFPLDWSDSARSEKIQASIPLARLGTFEELANTVTYLALDASYITAQVLALDGGRSKQLL
jgi:pteridine reductase